jgi:hypothetical protein
MQKAEGWYEDPWRIHERRWFSGGLATRLVADGDRETTDDPPDPSWEGVLEPWPIRYNGSPQDLSRADDTGRAHKCEWRRDRDGLRRATDAGLAQRRISKAHHRRRRDVSGG